MIEATFALVTTLISKCLSESSFATEIEKKMSEIIHQVISIFSKLFSTVLIFTVIHKEDYQNISEEFFKHTSKLLILTNHWNERSRYPTTQEPLLNHLYLITRANQNYLVSLIESDWIVPCIKDFMTPPSILAMINYCFKNSLPPLEMADFLLKNEVLQVHNSKKLIKREDLSRFDKFGNNFANTLSESVFESVE